MKKFISYAAAGAAVMVMAASCASTKKMNVSELSGRWEITAVNGKPVASSALESQPYLGFDVKEESISGNAGCNRIMGRFSTVGGDGHIKFDKVATTRMMCPDMTVEQSVLQALDKVVGYKAAGTGMVALTGENGSTLISLKEIKSDIEAADLNGTWLIRTLGGKELTPTPEASYTVTFDPANRTFSCSTGCNTLGGSFSADYSDFGFDLSTSTMMMCPDTSVEDTLKELLPSVTRYGRISDGGIGFYSDSDTPVMTLVR